MYYDISKFLRLRPKHMHEIKKKAIVLFYTFSFTIVTEKHNKLRLSWTSSSIAEIKTSWKSCISKLSRGKIELKLQQ